jgi:hypothetical protein
MDEIEAYVLRKVRLSTTIHRDHENAK